MRILLFLLFAMTSLGQEPNAPTQAQLTEFAQQEAQGNYRGYFDVAKFDPAFAVKYLGRHLRFTTDATDEDFRTAKQALRQVPGVEDYLKTQLEATLAGNGTYNKNDLFNWLADVGSEKAAAIVAPYAFNKTPPPPQNGDEVFGDIAGAALYSLAHMRLPDDPNHGKDPLFYRDADDYRWRAWAVKHGYVPKEWLAAYPVPTGITPLPSPTSPLASFSPSPSASATSAPSTPDLGFPWEIPVGVACVLLLAGSVFYFLKKR